MSLLRLDLDRHFSGCSWGAWCERTRHALTAADLEPLAVAVRRTRHGFHVEIATREDLPAATIVAMQAALGSDGIREAINARRAQHAPDQVEAWNVLFETKAHPDGVVTRTTPNIPAARRLRNELRKVWPGLVVVQE